MTHTVLKRDLFGTVSRIERDGEARIQRDISTAPVWTRWIARRLMERERRALAALKALPSCPVLLGSSRNSLERSFLAGEPMYVAKPRDPQFFREAKRLLFRMHRLSVSHNDLAKEPNILVTPDGKPAFIDFQLARHAPRRGRLFRILAREDLRHLLKHKRYYCADALTAREKAILATPSPLSRAYMVTLKPVYNFVTRKILRWADREGAGDRGAIR